MMRKPSSTLALLLLTAMLAGCSSAPAAQLQLDEVYDNIVKRYVD